MSVLHPVPSSLYLQHGQLVAEGATAPGHNDHIHSLALHSNITQSILLTSAYLGNFGNDEEARARLNTARFQEIKCARAKYFNSNGLH